MKDLAEVVDLSTEKLLYSALKIQCSLSNFVAVSILLISLQDYYLIVFVSVAG